MTKGIVLAGGAGTRLHPCTLAVSKQLLPIYDKPMIYYPLSVLMLAGIRDILLITTPEDMPNFKRLLGNGKQFGITLEYAIQEKPEGLAQAFIIGEQFIGEDNVCLVLGDNIFYGQGFPVMLRKVSEKKEGGTVFLYKVKNPSDFGIMELDPTGKPISIEEKPSTPKSNYAVTGLYFFDKHVSQFAREVKPSSRGELEITGVISRYLENKTLQVEFLGRGFAWLGTGTHKSLLEASHFVETIEARQGYQIACLEEIAFANDWLSKADLIQIAEKAGKNNYGIYIKALAEE